MTLIQILLLLVATLGAATAISRRRRGQITRIQLVGWIAFWAAAAAVTLRPEVTTAIARRFGVGRGADAVLYLAVAASFFLLFRLFARLEDMEHQVTKLTREIALRDLDRNPPAP